jgi:hypothetical protein
MNFTFIDFQVLKNKLRKTGSVEIRIVSGSMAPLLPVGSLASIEPCDFDHLNPFDLVVFFEEDKFICHTFWSGGAFPAANGDRTLMTWGLNNPDRDLPVAERFLFGRVTSHRLSPWRCFLFTLRRKFIRA